MGNRRGCIHGVLHGAGDGARGRPGQEGAQHHGQGCCGHQQEAAGLGQCGVALLPLSQLVGHALAQAVQFGEVAIGHRVQLRIDHAVDVLTHRLQLGQFDPLVAIGLSNLADFGQLGLAVVVLQQFFEPLDLAGCSAGGGFNVFFEAFDVGAVHGAQLRLRAGPIDADVRGPVVDQGLLLQFDRGDMLARELQHRNALYAKASHQQGDQQDGGKGDGQAGADFEVVVVHGLTAVTGKGKGKSQAKRGAEAGQIRTAYPRVHP